MRLCRGQILAVEFDDHCEGGGGQPIRFVVYGELSDVSRSHIVIDSWAYADRRVKHDANETRYTICRGTIKRITQLVARE